MDAPEATPLRCSTTPYIHHITDPVCSQSQPAVKIGFTPTDRGNALYYHEQALRFGDLEAAEKYLRQYAELGGTRKGLKASIRLAEPTARVPKKLRRRFMFSLSPSERQTLKAAQRWYKSVYQRRRLRKAG